MEFLYMWIRYPNIKSVSSLYVICYLYTMKEQAKLVLLFEWLSMVTNDIYTHSLTNQNSLPFLMRF